MINFFQNYWSEILLSLITAGALGVCKKLYSEIKRYRELLENSENDQITIKIKKELDPVIKEIEEYNNNFKNFEKKYNTYLNSIVRSYRYRLIYLCKQYLSQGRINSEQLEQLTEFYKVYHDLGGNGQAQEFFEKVLELPIKEE